MSQSKLKLKIVEPERDITHKQDPPISDALMIVIEKVYSLTGADGAVIALRDPLGVRCVASTGNAPAVGSRLQPDSEFTRECFETGRVMLCEDAEVDPRIRPSVARALHLRSVVAVPIQAQGLILGILEVFSSRPYSFNTHVAALEQIADLLAPALRAMAGEQSVANSPLRALKYPHLMMSGLGAHPSIMPSPSMRLVDSLGPPIEECTPVTGPEPKIRQWFVEKTTEARAWLARAKTCFSSFVGGLATMIRGISRQDEESSVTTRSLFEVRRPAHASHPNSDAHEAENLTGQKN